MANILNVKSGVEAKSLCFQFVYQSLEGYSNLIARKVQNTGAATDFRFRSFIYTTKAQNFIDHVHESHPCGLLDSLQTGAVIFPIQQGAFFYLSQLDHSLILITELTATFVSGNKTLCVCLGWSMLPIFDHQGNRLSVGIKSGVGGMAGDTTSLRLALYEGSPRVLFSLTHPIAESKILVPIPGCILTCSLCPHVTLGKASHLIPPNVLVSYDDIIPGLLSTKVLEAFPKLMKTTSCNLERVSLLLLPSVEDFEDQLLATLSDDLMFDGSILDENSSITIEERRLKVLLYNGWRFISSPAIGYLERTSHTGKTSGSFRGSTYGLRSNLILKGSLEVSDLISHPLLEVVLQLEYVISWSKATAYTSNSAPGTPYRNADTKDKPSSTHSTTITLCWGVWQPFDPEHGMKEDIQSSTVSLELKSGPGFKPTVIPNSAHSACYQNKLTDAGKVAFKWTLSARASNRIEGSQILTASESNVVHHEDALPLKAGTETLDLSGIPARSLSPRETEAGKVIQQHVQESNLSDTNSEIKPVLRVNATQVDIKANTRTHGIGASVEVVAIQRSHLAYFHSTGLEGFKDSKGNVLPSVDVANGRSNVASVRDALQNGPYSVAVQILGYSLLKDECPNRLTTTLYFHSFPPRVTHNSSICPPPDGGSLPYILRPIGGTDNSQENAYHFEISHSMLPTKKDREEFTLYLKYGNLFIDVYDGNSLILLGVARVPLQSLLAQPEDLVSFQISLSCPIMFAPSTIDFTMNMIDEPNEHMKMCGRIYLRLAKMHHSRNLSAPLHTNDTTTKGSRTPVPRRLYENVSHLKPGRKHEDEGTHMRKVMRMHKVREAKVTQGFDTVFHNQHGADLFSQSENSFEAQREELRREKITTVLQDAITFHYTLRSRTGRSVYFEHPFINTYNHPLTLTVSWKDPDLKLVTNMVECHCLRQLCGINSAVENLIIEDTNKSNCGFFVHPGETIKLPFKYQAFRLPSVSVSEICSPGFVKSRKIVKVYLQIEHGTLLAILNVNVELQPHTIHRVMHFYHPQKMIFRKHILIHPENLNIQSTKMEQIFEEENNSSRELFTRCSDPDAYCEIEQCENSFAVFIKISSSLSPTSHMFYVMLYNQEYLLEPFEVWQIVIHSVHRVDHTLTLGQTSTFKLTLRGDSINRRVMCYSYTTTVMKVVCPSPFLLSNSSVSEISLTLKTVSPVMSNVLIAAVDVNENKVVDSWMICLTSQHPPVTKAFEIRLPIGQTKAIQKTIKFLNPYHNKRIFLLSTSLPDIIYFKRNIISLQPQESVDLRLQFAPLSYSVNMNVFVFINTEADQTEECFLVKTLYT